MNTLRLRLAKVAASQQGLVSRDDLRALEVTPRQRRTLVSDGSLELIGTRAFRMAGSPATPDQTLMAACIDTGGVASHRAAARLHRIGNLGEPRMEVLVARPRHDYQRPGVTVHSTTWLPASEVTSVRGIPCTSVPRTLLGLAALAPRQMEVDSVRDAVDVAVRDGVASMRWLWWHLEHVRRRGRPGVATMEKILCVRESGGITESWLEREMLRLLEDGGLPLPVCQARIEQRGSFVARVDFLYPAERLVIEVHGYQHHSSRSELMADARRRSELLLAGYRVLEFTFDELVQTPERVLKVVAAALSGLQAA